MKENVLTMGISMGCAIEGVSIRHCRVAYMIATAKNSTNFLNIVAVEN